MRTPLLLLVLLATVLVSACAGDDDDDDATPLFSAILFDPAAPTVVVGSSVNVAISLEYSAGGTVAIEELAGEVNHGCGQYNADAGILTVGAVGYECVVTGIGPGSAPLLVEVYEETGMPPPEGLLIKDSAMVLVVASGD